MTLTQQFAADNGLPAGVVNDIEVALDEALSNIMAHGYETPASGTIVVRLAYRDGVVCIEVEDDGRAFDPLRAPPPDLGTDLAQRRVGGLGIHLIRCLMDAVCYDRRDGKNLLRLSKRVPAQAG
jgi:serine/threonine-protein kinase RsbW